jgi:hypothetical protein
LSEATTSLNKVREKSKQIRKRRNKQIAHSHCQILLHQYAHELKVLLKPAIEPATSREIDKALESLAAFMEVLAFPEPFHPKAQRLALHWRSRASLMCAREELLCDSSDDRKEIHQLKGFRYIAGGTEL